MFYNSLCSSQFLNQFVTSVCVIIKVFYLPNSYLQFHRLGRNVHVNLATSDSQSGTVLTLPPLDSGYLPRGLCNRIQSRATRL